jgi:hypothetical protein
MGLFAESRMLAYTRARRKGRASNRCEQGREAERECTNHGDA